MKHIAIVYAVFIFFVSTASAENFSGTLVDVMCKDNELTSHPRRCAISCAKYGYGLKESDGTFLKFDADGNARALAALKGSRRVQDLKATVTGLVENGVLKVESIQIH